LRSKERLVSISYSVLAAAAGGAGGGAEPIGAGAILRHVGLWPDSEFGVGIDAIRGPPEDIWPAELDPSADMAAVDDELPTDWAA